MKTMTLSLSNEEAAVLAKLAATHELSHAQLLRQALSLYQKVHLKAKAGHTMAFVDAEGNVVKQIIPGLGVLE